ncbi:MAG: ABC transporter ATP-binding protein [Thermincolia bacterium]
MIGPSGSGKSTLLSLVNRMQTPDEGDVYFHGLNYKEYQVTQLRQRIGLVHQTPTMLQGTVRDNINYGPLLRNAPLSPREIEGLLDLVGFGRGFLERPATELSGGEKQRVSLMRTLANNPEVLLLDEITASLDPVSQELVEQVILALNREKNLTILWVSHNLQQVQRVGGQTWFVHQGRLLETAPTRDFFARPGTPEGEEFLHSKKET